ncbi:hypothetical protein CBG46_00335 [Actinobacillus succinogenes]|uniref:YwiC-like protein n=1 Tax=Actinobacillus succinogenes (strain ATCC 55618 / DSM 22257 / CCUG 43843 / 130Z) TaxID=339671 RepID=A6VMZ7_ACTSZ|nr:YwiC-like family protein [Actinobacillus succinogenes]ABR74344.1 conserved hypothetical protein [Actinobacillus succinogenes 130Z]PHI39235.1 hypothetical protein CBG46_00335 [Actinobacillus succinogenes]
MKLLVSNQYGAIVMAMLPFLYGLLLGQPRWMHLFLLLAWSALYLFTYPFLNLFKPQIKDKRQYVRWSWIYGAASAVFCVPVLRCNSKILWFGVAMLPLLLVNIYYTKTKNERALLNDFAGIAVFALAGVAAYYFGSAQLNAEALQVAVYPALFFIGITFYVKSMLRERKNPRYFRLSVGFHLACVVAMSCCQSWRLALTFAPALIRAAWLPHKKLNAKQVGLIEFAVSGLFLVMLLWATKK